MRERKIILEADLLFRAQAFRLILVHELFHFVWPRLGNHARSGFNSLLLDEWRNGARGELGESSAVKKDLFRRSIVQNPRLWGDYVCESFCDTAAWVHARFEDSAVFTLRKRWRERRKAWFVATANNAAWKC